jgi:hypothetical protein
VSPKQRFLLLVMQEAEPKMLLKKVMAVTARTVQLMFDAFDGVTFFLG